MVLKLQNCENPSLLIIPTCPLSSLKSLFLRTQPPSKQPSMAANWDRQVASSLTTSTDWSITFEEITPSSAGTPGTCNFKHDPSKSKLRFQKALASWIPQGFVPVLRVLSLRFVYFHWTPDGNMGLGESFRADVLRC